MHVIVIIIVQFLLFCQPLLICISVRKERYRNVLLLIMYLRFTESSIFCGCPLTEDKPRPPFNFGSFIVFYICCLVQCVHYYEASYSGGWKPNCFNSYVTPKQYREVAVVASHDHIVASLTFNVCDVASKALVIIQKTTTFFIFMSFGWTK